MSALRAQTAATRRQEWRKLAEMGLRMGQRCVDTDGRETLEPIDLPRALALHGKAWIDGDAAGGALATSFYLSLQALRGAGTERRRAILGAVVVALAKAVDELITDQADREAAVWKRQTGED